MNSHERYNQSPKGRARYERYRASEKGRRNERIQHGRLRFRERNARMSDIKKELSHP